MQRRYLEFKRNLWWCSRLSKRCWTSTNSLARIWIRLPCVFVCVKERRFGSQKRFRRRERARTTTENAWLNKIIIKLFVFYNRDIFAWSFQAQSFEIVMGPREFIAEYHSSPANKRYSRSFIAVAEKATLADLCVCLFIFATKTSKSAHALETYHAHNSYNTSIFFLPIFKLILQLCELKYFQNEKRKKKTKIIEIRFFFS